MRPQLFFGGLFVGITGLGFYVLELPLVYYWSIPFAIGGGLMIIASLFLAETPGRLTPPEGFRFCVYCSNPVPLASDRCPHCNGIQPRMSA